jgi:hypothetical protein
VYSTRERVQATLDEQRRRLFADHTMRELE